MSDVKPNKLANQNKWITPSVARVSIEEGQGEGGGTLIT